MSLCAADAISTRTGPHACQSIVHLAHLVHHITHSSSQIHSPWMGAKVDSGIGLSYRPAMWPGGPVRQPYPTTQDFDFGCRTIWIYCISQCLSNLESHPLLDKYKVPSVQFFIASLWTERTFVSFSTTFAINYISQILLSISASFSFLCTPKFLPILFFLFHQASPFLETNSPTSKDRIYQSSEKDIGAIVLDSVSCQTFSYPIDKLLCQST